MRLTSDRFDRRNSANRPNLAFVSGRAILAWILLLGLVVFPSQNFAQSGGGNGNGEDASEETSTLDLPLIGEIELPSWLSFLGSASSEGSGESAEGAGEGGQGQGGQQQPPAVVVTEAELRSVGDEFEFIGTIEAIENVTLQARVNGFIEEVFFEGGDLVEVGDPLFKIEDDQYQASLNSAEAQLASAEAQVAEAQRSLSRAQELIDSGTIPQAELDNARATYETAEASRLQAEAQVRQAQLNLNYTSVEAPIAGVISEPQITRGNFVSAASGTLAELVQLDPIWGTFPISENRLGAWRRIGMDEEGDAEAQSPDEDYRLTLRLPNDESFDQDGTFAFVGNSVDPSTGTIEVRIRFPNPRGRLLPNENVTLVAAEREPPRLPVVPQAAIQLTREGRSLFVLNDDGNTVRRQTVQVGQQLQGSVAITSGIEAGDLVVVQGVQSLEDGAAVDANFEDGSPAPGGPIRDGEDGGEPRTETPEQSARASPTETEAEGSEAADGSDGNQGGS